MNKFSQPRKDPASAENSTNFAIESLSERERRRPRPVVEMETLIAAVAIYFVLVMNSAFWSSLWGTGTLAGVSGVKILMCVGMAIFALHALLIALFSTRWLIKPFLTVLLLVASGASYFSSKYSVYIDPSMIRNVLRTDLAEAGELMTAGLWFQTLLLGIAPALLVWIVRIKPRSIRQAIARRATFVVAMLALASISLFAILDEFSPIMRNHPSMRYLIAPGNALVATTKVLSETTRAQGASRQVVGADARLTGHEAPTKPHFLVIVVGETVRAQNWGLNGYFRQTTPQLAALDVVNFSDVTACGSNTEVSVPCMFSSSGRRRYDREQIVNSESLLHVLERAGVETLWRDNQTGCKGVCDGLPFESYRKQRVDPLCDGQTCRDAVMLQGLHDAIDDSPGDVVVVLHQLGNHGPSYFKRYTTEFRKFVPDCVNPDLGKCTRREIVNAYDNAILATDDFLAEVIRMLAADASHDTAMIYLSDHGESLGENNVYLHGFPYAIAPDAQIKVPMLAWLSEGMASSTGTDTRCLKERSALPVSHDNLFHSVLGLMEVGTVAYESDLDVFAACRREAEAR